jgi:hypothetical protein
MELKALTPISYAVKQIPPNRNLKTTKKITNILALTVGWRSNERFVLYPYKTL